MVSKSYDTKNLLKYDEEKENEILNIKQELSLNMPKNNYEMASVSQITPIDTDMINETFDLSDSDIIFMKEPITESSGKRKVYK